MKKLLKISAFALVLLMLVAAFASCAGPADDADDARRALIKNKYEVTIVDDDDPTIATLEKEYDLFGLEEYLTAIDNENWSEAKNFIFIFYFDETRDAKDSMAGIEKLIEEQKKELKDAGLKIDDMELELDRSGEVIWWGTPDAVKAAK